MLTLIKKKAEMTILINFRANNITSNKEGNFTIIKGSTHPEDVH